MIENEPLPGMPEPPVAGVTLEEQLEHTQKANIDLLNGLARDRIAFDPPILILQLKLRLDMLTELLAPSGGDLRGAFELSYEQRLNQMLEAAVRDSARAKLLQK